MTVRVFPSKFSDEPAEVYNFDGPTVGDWLAANIPSYSRHRVQQFSVTVNGQSICQADWHARLVAPYDVVDITVEPKGTELFFGGLFLVATRMMTPKIPKMSGVNSTSGKDLDKAVVKGNKVKLNSVRPQIAGRRKIFPNYLKPTRRYFNDFRDQRVDLCLDVGVGSFDIQAADIMIGDTPLISFGDDASYQIYQPGESLAADLRARWWHDVQEVGAGSNGSSGLDLTEGTPLTANYTADALQYGGYNVSISGAGAFPSDWAPGAIVRIDVPYQYEVFDGGAGRSVIRGMALEMLNPTLGNSIEIVGQGDGIYVVNTYTPYVAPTSPSAGTPSKLTGSAPPTRYDFDVTPITFSVGGGSINNILIDSYSWLTTATLPPVTLTGITATAVTSAGSPDGYGIRCVSSSASTSERIMLCPSDDSAGWNVPIKAGIYLVSAYISTSTPGASVRFGLNDGGDRLSSVQAITAARTRYTFEIVVAAPSTCGVAFYPNMSAVTGTTVTVDDVMVEYKGATSSPSPFVRGTRVLTIDTATSDLAGLVAAINTVKGSAPFNATGVAGVVVITETGTPTGKEITSTTAVDILGLDPVSDPGSAPTAAGPEQLPTMTLNFPDTSPVGSLPLGYVTMAIGPVGLRYSLVAADVANLNVARLTSSGAPDASFPGFQSLITSESLISLDSSSLQGGYRGPIAMCPAGELTQTIEYDVFCPRGLIAVGRKKGNERELNSDHQLEWRDMALSGAWTPVHNTFTAKSRDAIGKTFTVNLPYPMRPEVRIKKLFINTLGWRRSEYTDDLVWYGARSLLNGATVYPGNTTITLTVRGGDRLAAQAESQVWLKATRKLEVRRGGAWQPAETTRDIVPFCLYLLKSVGYTDDDLDLAEWDRLDVFWRARGDTYDRVHDDGSTVQQVIEEALAAGFAELTVKNGLLRPVRDEPQTLYKALYTADATMGNLDIRFDAVRVDDYDGVDVEYTDGIQWQIATVKCRLPGDLGRRVLVVKLEGVTNKTKAYQIGMRRRRELRYRRKTFSWKTEMAALNSNYMDYVQVAGEAPGYAQSTIMEAYDSVNAIVTATEPLDWDGLASPYFMSVRREDGSCFGPVQVTKLDDYRAALLTPADFAPILDLSITRPHILFGVGYSVQITDIDPNGTDEVSVKAQAYTPQVYLDDDSLPPP